MLPPLEILAPAGDQDCLDAALRAGADAVYFGLDTGFNARARASNFSEARLGDVMDEIHDCGRRGYLTLNTLVFDDELAKIERIIDRAAESGVDAVIVQDLGVARLVKRMVPSMRLHASTQTTCTDHIAIEVLTRLGAERITLARELSLKELAQLAADSPAELEIFAHGALCIAYSGQCLTSEAIGGRSANRGACAQACRLPYGLVVDGVLRDLADVAYLLSPRDLDACQMLSAILATGVRAIKIEGRLKGSEYVAATTRLYRLALDEALATAGSRPDSDPPRETSKVQGASTSGPDANLGASLDGAPRERRPRATRERLHELSAQAFSRGAGTGFLAGVDHQALVEGTTCDHIGVELGHCLGTSVVAGRAGLRIRSERAVTLGDGILVQGDGPGADELGGRIWQIRLHGREVPSCEAAAEIWVWLGPERNLRDDYAGRRVFRTSASQAAADLASLLPKEPERVTLSARLEGEVGALPRLKLVASDGRSAEVTIDQPLELARTRAIDVATIREKLERLGETHYELAQLDVALPKETILPLSSLNRARRAAASELRRQAHRCHPIALASAVEAELVWPQKPHPERGLYVTCRTREQAEAAIGAGARGIYLDFLALTGAGQALRELRSRHAVSMGLALPRIRKLGEDKIDNYVRGLEPDLVLVRSLGSLGSLADAGDVSPAKTHQPVWVGDFSLNATNSLTAVELLSRPLSVFTPGYDLDAAQLLALLDSPLAGFAEVVVHHPMPLFHMEHCVFAALLSEGKDHRDCGRPCELHSLALRDRTGLDLPVVADVGCRNTVFHGIAQSAADVVGRLLGQGVGRFRIELVRETGVETEAIVRSYAELLAGQLAPSALRLRLSASGVRMVRGSLRVVG